MSDEKNPNRKARVPKGKSRASTQPPSCYGALVKREKGDSKKVPKSNPCGRGGEKDALYRWESMGGSFLYARGGTASSDGAYKLKLGTLGPTNKFKAKWLKEPLAGRQPHREHWLVDKGCQAQTVNAHQKRGTAWMRKQKDKADWQARFGKAAEYIALQRRPDS
eukprot:1156155-Pelagomonas_calceolata.AAC.1